jgi:hypothetical protein
MHEVSLSKLDKIGVSWTDSVPRDIGAFPRDAVPSSSFRVGGLEQRSSLLLSPFGVCSGELRLCIVVHKDDGFGVIRYTDIGCGVSEETLVEA